MDKGKQQQLNLSGNDNGDDGDELAGSTLEDYFAMHKGSGHVSQHLLNVPTENDVMAAENVDGEDKDGNGESDRRLAKEYEARTEQDNYEDDYESETASPKAETPSDLAGMSLSDYLHVKEDDNADAQEKLSRAGSLRALPPQIAASAKKPAPMPDVSGMSLDHYLGASSGDNLEEKKQGAQADKKSSPNAKRKGSKSKQSGAVLPQTKAISQPFSVKGSGIMHGSHTNSNSQHLSSDEESSSANSPDSNLTPFQRRQKRKEKAKIKQQRKTGNGLSVSKTILMAEAGSSQSTILSVRDREKRKGSLTSLNAPAHSHHPSHHGSNSSASHFQPPLPKLAVSSSIRSLSHKDHDTQDNAEKLPPL